VRKKDFSELVKGNVNFSWRRESSSWAWDSWWSSLCYRKGGLSFERNGGGKSMREGNGLTIEQGGKLLRGEGDLSRTARWGGKGVSLVRGVNLSCP